MVRVGVGVRVRVGVRVWEKARPEANARRGRGEVLSVGLGGV